MSEENDTIRMTQLLVSRLCHDLVGPVGAVNAGLEFLQGEAGKGALDADALGLATKSADQMGRKVVFFRVAFGVGLSGRDGPLAEALALTQGFLADRDIRFDGSGLPGGLARGDMSQGTAQIIAKVFLNLVLLGADSLPRGGAMTMTLEPENDAFLLNMVATGERAGLRSETIVGLEASTTEGLDARSVHGFFAKKLVEGAGGRLEVQTLNQGEGGKIVLRAGPFPSI